MEKESSRRERKEGGGEDCDMRERSRGEGKVCRCDTGSGVGGEKGGGGASGYHGERGGEERRTGEEAEEMIRQGHSSKTDGWG